MNLLNPVLTLLFPQQCNICGRHLDSLEGRPACRRCWDATRLFTGNETLCSKCGKIQSFNPTNAKVFCHDCDEHFYDFAAACGPYEKGLAATVLALKSTPKVSSRAVKLLFNRYISASFTTADLIIPIPLSKQRLFERGHNQSETIARGFSKTSGIKIDVASLYRRRHSKRSRVSMDRKGRAQSVQNAFAVKRVSLIKGKTILLFDDVFTSGATASMAAKALKKGGAARVEVLTLARAKYSDQI